MYSWLTDDPFCYFFSLSLLPRYHPTSTCKIGAVVDANLRVLGVANLRVADASVMPSIISGNTNAPSIMIGEKCAGMMKAEYRLTSTQLCVGPKKSSMLLPLTLVAVAVGCAAFVLQGGRVGTIWARLFDTSL
jgi:hypothetical protein